MMNIKSRLSYVTFVTLFVSSGCSNISEQISASDAPDIGIRISSVPEGAEVYIMGHNKGVTPTRINQQDLYPPSYKLSNEHLYGKVQLKKNGCITYTRRLSRSEISNGLKVNLDCTVTTPAETGNKSTATQITPVINNKASIEITKTPKTLSADSDDKQLADPRYKPAATPESNIHERKLQQLKSLQQLRDEGFLSEKEERTLRKKILKEY